MLELLVFQVEHVVREEKTMAAYEIIELYCELIVARLPIIESQKYVLSCCFDLHILLIDVQFMLFSHLSIFNFDMFFFFNELAKRTLLQVD